MLQPKNVRLLVSGPLLLSLCLALVVAPTTHAIDKVFYSNNDIIFSGDDPAPTCSTTTSSASSGALGTNYAGVAVLTDAQKAKINQLTPIYKAAATEADIPWQLLAAIHLRESSLGQANLKNGQGIYQLYSLYVANTPEGNTYRSLAAFTNGGNVSDDNFKQQTIYAAKYIKAKESSNSTNNRNLTATSGPEVIKDTLFSFNGRAKVYKNQAKDLGFDPETQGYEGSPYVMNRVDAIRDPVANPNKQWGQIKTDGGSIVYPANTDFGAFVVYSAIANVASDSCSSSSISGSIIEKVIKIADQELQLWNSGSLKPGDGSFKKYTGGQSGNWCAWFVSWVYNQAGYPISQTSTNGMVSLVDQVMSYGVTGPRFEYHAKNGYTPKVGDIVIQKEGSTSHVNLVVAVEGSKITVIGGNQGGNGQGYTMSKVTKYSMGSTDNPITGYVTAKQ